jgi:hypothetical protein
VRWVANEGGIPSIVPTPEGSFEVDDVQRVDTGVTRFRLRGAAQSSTVTVRNSVTVATIVTPTGTIWTAMPSGRLVKAESSFSCHVERATKDMPHSVIASLSNTAKRRAIGAQPIPIDLMEVYGPWHLRQAGSVEAAETLVQHQVDATNTALHDSGLGTIRLRLRHIRFSQKHDRFPPEVDPAVAFEADRRYFGADLLGLAVGETPIGIAGLACRPPAYGPGCGVHWVHFSNFTVSPVAFVHEVGHNLGADHDAPNAMPREVDPHPFARAHCVPGLWRTVMSYGNPCLANPILQYSNPRRSHFGLATGVEDQEDNARAIAISAPLVRDYYPETANVGPRCEFRVTSDLSDVPVSGTTMRVLVERTRGDCAPEVTSTEEWIRIELVPGATAVRSEADVTVVANEGRARRGYIVAGEQPVAVDQAGAVSCLTPNGSFDRDLDGWTVEPAFASASWSPWNATPGQASGSAMLTGTGRISIERCFAIAPADHYFLRSSIYIPPGQTAGEYDFPALQLYYLYPTTDCSGLQPNGAGDLMRNIPGIWLPIETTINTRNPGHPEARSIRVSLTVSVNTGLPFTTHFDDVRLCKLD